MVIAEAARAEEAHVAELVGGLDRLLHRLEQVGPRTPPPVRVGEVHEQVVAVLEGGVGVLGLRRRAAAREQLGGGIVRVHPARGTPPALRAARQARPACAGPAASQCRAVSLSRSGSCSSTSATRACARARRVALNDP